MADPRSLGDADSGSPVIVAIDQGTSSTKVIVVDDSGAIASSSVVAVGQTHPRPGWVEQDAEEILQSVLSALFEATAAFRDRIVGLGVSSQRESALVWDRATGQSLGPVLGWQDRRTSGRAAEIAADLAAAGQADMVREITGLPLDPMFSALKLAWLLDLVDPDRTRSRAGEICVGTIDSWLLFRLTGEHRIESGNASRTQLLNLGTLDWDDRLLELFGVPRAALPQVTASTTPSAPVQGLLSVPDGTRVLSVMCDSHSALFAHGVREPGAVKVTYGTGSSVMGLLPDSGSLPTEPGNHGLVTTLAWQTDGGARYAFEGNILSTGSTMVWLAGLLGGTPGDLFDLAATAPENHGLHFVPAFSGLGAPWWDEDARAMIVGLTLGTERAAVARAAAESIPQQIEDVLTAADGEARIERVLVDGGPSANDWLMQVQADLSQRSVVRPQLAALSALGVAYLAGIEAGMWSDAEVRALPGASTSFEPILPPEAVWLRRQSWLDAVDLSRVPSASTTVKKRESR